MPTIESHAARERSTTLESLQACTLQHAGVHVTTVKSQRAAESEEASRRPGDRSPTAIEDQLDELADKVKAQLNEWAVDYKEWCEIYLLDSVPFTDNPTTHQSTPLNLEAEEKSKAERANTRPATEEPKAGLGDNNTAKPEAFYTAMFTGETLRTEGNATDR